MVNVLLPTIRLWFEMLIFSYDFTSKIKRMYDDIATSATNQEEYNKTTENDHQGTFFPLCTIFGLTRC